ncbi:hypothetical protein Tco_0662818 [Tanacetum coccineum]
MTGRGIFRLFSDVNESDVGCLMLATMAPELQVNYMGVGAFDLINQLRLTFLTQARAEGFDVIVNLSNCKIAEGSLLILNYNINNVEGGTVAELHNMLKTAERGIQQKSKDVLVVASGNHGMNGGKWKGRGGNGKNNNSSKKVFRGFKPNRGEEERSIEAEAAADV